MCFSMMSLKLSYKLLPDHISANHKEAYTGLYAAFT